MNKKKIIAAVSAAALMTVNVSAQSVIIDGAKITNTAYQAGETIMLPLRSVCEAMDYIVEWDAQTRGITLTKGAHYITMNLDVDGYTFARTAPIKLGTAPTLSKEGVTFVPANFISDILQTEYSVAENGDLMINTVVEEETEVAEEAAAGYAKIVKIEENTVTVEDTEMGEVILNISEETEILDMEGNKITVADLKTEDNIIVVYSDAMTLSLPPQNNPVKVQIFVKETAETEGEIRAFEDGKILIGSENPMEQTALVISEETKILDMEGNEIAADDLKEGDKIKAVHSPAMTFSIPPQTAAYEIIVIK